MITKHNVRSCCGSKNTFLWDLPAPLKKEHSVAFKAAGFVVPLHMNRTGMFFVERKGLVASAPFGSSKLNVRCNLRDCTEALASLEVLFNQLLEPKEVPEPNNDD